MLQIRLDKWDGKVGQEDTQNTVLYMQVLGPTGEKHTVGHFKSIFGNESRAFNSC